MEKVGKQKLLEEIMAKNVPNLMKTINSHVQEVWQTPSTRNINKATPGIAQLNWSKPIIKKNS